MRDEKGSPNICLINVLNPSLTKPSPVFGVHTEGAVLWEHGGDFSFVVQGLGCVSCSADAPPSDVATQRVPCTVVHSGSGKSFLLVCLWAWRGFDLYSCAA